MESQARYTLVGGIVVTVLVLLVTILVWISGVRDQTLLLFYQINFRQFSLSGLQMESPVSMRGIRIGKVESIRIDPDDVGLVTVVISIGADAPIRADTEAVIERNLLTGLAGIDLVRGTRDALLIQGAPQGGEYPIIPEGRSSFGSLQESIPQLSERISLLVTRLSTFFTPENQFSFSAMLHDMQELSAKLNRDDSGLISLSTQLTQLTEDLRQLSQTLDSRTNTLATSVETATGTVQLEAHRLGDSLSSSARDLSYTLKQFDDPRSILFGKDAAALGPGEK